MRFVNKYVYGFACVLIGVLGLIAEEGRHGQRILIPEYYGHIFGLALMLGGLLILGYMELLPEPFDKKED